MPITGARFCVIGCGLTVGRPLGLMLTRRSEHATVTLCHEATLDVAMPSCDGFAGRFILDREILGGFLLGRNITRKLSSLDLVQLMENKQKAAANRDQTFEELLLETGRLIDEIGREEEDFERLESFGELVTLFDRIDHTTTLVNKLAFMDDVELTQEQVRSLLGNMQVFEKLRRGLFQQLFIDPVVSNEYALAYGKKKLYALTLGLMFVDAVRAGLVEPGDP